MTLPETHAMLISIREKWAVHTNTGKVLFVEREYDDDDIQRWSYTQISDMLDETLIKCIGIIERQREAHGHWPEPPEPEYMPGEDEVRYVTMKWQLMQDSRSVKGK